MFWEPYMLGLASLLPILGAFASPFIWVVVRRPGAVRAWALAVITATFAVTLLNLNHILCGSRLGVETYYFGGWILSMNFQGGIVYTVDALSALLGFVAAGLVLAAAVYSLDYIRGSGEEWYYTLLMGLLAGLIGIFYTGDAFNLFVMLEVASVSAYALVAYYRRSGPAVEAALKYAIVGSIATTIYFISLVILYTSISQISVKVGDETVYLSTLNIAGMQLAYRLAASSGVSGINVLAPAAAIFISMAVWVFMTKAALFPNHFWLPDAHPAAPSPVSALLSGVVVKAGIYAMIRFIYTVYMPSAYQPIVSITDALMNTIVVVGALSSLIAGFMMLVQEDVKRLIAYSTIMHMGYIAMGIGLGTRMGLEASIYHMLTHAVGKALLFLSAGAAIMVTGTRNINELQGIAGRARITAAGIIISTLSLAGAFPFGGFASKLVLYLAFIERGAFILAVILITTSAMAFASYAKLLYGLVFKRPVDRDRKAVPGKAMNAVITILSIIVVLLGVLAPYVLGGLVSPVASSVLNYDSYYRSVLLR